MDGDGGRRERSRQHVTNADRLAERSYERIECKKVEQPHYSRRGSTSGIETTNSKSQIEKLLYEVKIGQNVCFIRQKRHYFCKGGRQFCYSNFFALNSNVDIIIKWIGDGASDREYFASSLGYEFSVSCSETTSVQ